VDEFFSRSIQPKASPQAPQKEKKARAGASRKKSKRQAPSISLKDPSKKKKRARDQKDQLKVDLSDDAKSE